MTKQNLDTSQSKKGNNPGLNQDFNRSKTNVNLKKHRWLKTRVQCTPTHNKNRLQRCNFRCDRGASYKDFLPRDAVACNTKSTFMRELGWIEFA